MINETIFINIDAAPSSAQITECRTDDLLLVMWDIIIIMVFTKIDIPHNNHHYLFDLAFRAHVGSCPVYLRYYHLFQGPRCLRL